MLDLPEDFVSPPEAPVFEPTTEEFADPLAYVYKIKPIVEKFGICKIRPPAEWQPPFAIDVDNFRFTPRVQRLHELEATTRVKLNFLDRLSKFWELQGTPLRMPSIDKKMLDLHRLHKVVRTEGGFDTVTREKKWPKVSQRLGYPLSTGHKSVASILRTHYEKLLYPYDLFEAGVTVDHHKLKEDIPRGKEDEVTKKALQSGRYTGRTTKKTLKEIENDACQLCERSDNESQLLLCDGCDDAFHTYCLMPPLVEVPKGDWRCPRCVALECNKPKEAYGFDQSQKSYTLQEFGEMADQFKADYFNMPVHLVTTAAVEKEFWRLVSSIDEDVTVQYGADVHALLNGSGFPTKKTQDVYPQDEAYINSSWNLNNLPLNERSVLRFVTGEVSGMKVPWCYVGMCFSSFAWHIEDHWSYSINYLHWGEPKTWYGVPSSQAGALEEVMKSRAPELFEQTPDLLHQLTTIMNPNTLMTHGISIVRTNQCAGEFIVTFPRAYHAGFNQGYNFAEAVNFCPADWLPYGRACLENYKLVQRQCVFSHEELVCKMAADPDRLDLHLAAEAYKEMLHIVDAEKRLRKMLHEKGVSEAEREAFELVPDDERQCSYCRTTCFLSALTCPCKPSEVVCISHIDHLCTCSPAQMCLRYRYTLDELPGMLIRLKNRADAYDIWSSRVKSALTAENGSKLSVAELKSLVAECKEKKYPDSPSLQSLSSAVEDAEKCASVAGQLLSRKMPRTRHRQSSLSNGNGDHRHGVGARLTVNELRQFLAQINKLPCRLKESEPINELLQKVVEFQQEAQNALAAEVPPESDKLETLLEYGINLDIDVLEIPKLKQVLSQARWLDEVKLALADCEGNDPGDGDSGDGGVALDSMRKLLESGVTLAPHPAVEKAMAVLQELLSSSERWEEKARTCLQARPKHTIGTLEAIVNESRSVVAYLPNVNALKDVLRKAKEWCAKVEALQSDEHNPYVEVLQAVMQKGRNMAVSLDLLPGIENTVNNANTWKERTSRTFLKKNTNYTLLEVLSPRSDIGVYASGKKRKKKEGEGVRGDGSDSGDGKVDEFRDPASMVAAFKQSELREIDSLRELRTRNMDKQRQEESSDEQQKYCICRKAPAGFMLQCELCKDWFHGTCVPLPKTSGMKTKPGQAALMQAAKELKFLCPLCLRSRRPRLETILSLLVSLQKLPVRIIEGEALQCLTERAMAWQDRARQALATEELARALARLSALSQRAVEQAAREKTEKIINAELLKAASNPELQGHLHAAALLQSAFGGGTSSAVLATDAIIKEERMPYESSVSSVDVSKLGMAEVSEHAYSSASKTATSQNESPRKHVRKSPLVPRQLESSSPSSAPTALELSDMARARLEELMMEGDLLEVSLDETQHIWKILQACSSGGIGNSASCRDVSDKFTDFKEIEPDGLVAKKVGADNLERKEKKRKSLKKEADEENDVSSLNNSIREKKRKKSDAVVSSNGAVKGKEKGDVTSSKAKDSGSGSTISSSNGSVCGKKEARKKEVKKKKRSPESSRKSSTSIADDSNEDSADEDCSADRCLKPTGDEVDWVQCDICQQWFHLLCIGLGKEEIAAVDNFVCCKCKKKPLDEMNGSDCSKLPLEGVVPKPANAAPSVSRSSQPGCSLSARGERKGGGSGAGHAALPSTPAHLVASSGPTAISCSLSDMQLEALETDGIISVVSTPVPSMPASPAATSADQLPPQPALAARSSSPHPAESPSLCNDSVVATYATMLLADDTGC